MEDDNNLEDNNDLENDNNFEEDDNELDNIEETVANSIIDHFFAASAVSFDKKDCPIIYIDNSNSL